MHAPNVLFNLFLLDLAFPIFEALKKHMIKSPSFSYYVLQAFKNWTWVTIFLRIVDAFTDITLTKTYFEDFDSVVNDFIGNTLSLQPGNSSCLDIACVKNQCLESEIWSHKLIYSHLSNNRGGWNNRGGGAKVAKSINVEAGINVEGGIFWKKLVYKCNKR